MKYRAVLYTVRALERPKQIFAMDFETCADWAKLVLAAESKTSFVTVYEIKEVLVERIHAPAPAVTD